MRITSPAFSDGETIPEQYTCEGPNINPPLIFEDMPAETASLVLIVEDPDAEAKPWVHWLIFNIPPSTTEVRENSIPAGGIEGIANGGTKGYEGPCPPSGTHTYLFKLYALDTMLQLSDTADRAVILEAIKGHVLAEATLSGVYQLGRVPTPYP